MAQGCVPASATPVETPVRTVIANSKASAHGLIRGSGSAMKLSSRGTWRDVSAATAAMSRRLRICMAINFSFS